MKLRSTLRRGALFAVALALSGFVAAQPRGPARGAAPAAAAMVNGLIVELRDAPTHVELARERAQARGAAAPAGAREGGRWQRLVSDLRADAALVREVPALAQAPRRDPVGARAQVLRFARPLTPEQAARVAERLAAQPDVAWVEPNVRERRQATASSPPADPYFPGTDGQWWLQPVQGSNTSTIDTRLRGVPGFLTAWTYGTTGESTAVVAVLDTGTTLHPELTGRFLPGYDFVSDWDPVTQRGYANDGDGRDADASDPGDWVDAADRSADPVRYGDCEVEVSSWHGTVIAGMLAGVTNNGAGGAAMNWNGRCCRCAWPASAVPTSPTSSTACAGPPGCRRARPATVPAVVPSSRRPIRTRRASSTSASVAARPVAPPTSRRSTNCAPRRAVAPWSWPPLATVGVRHRARPIASA